MTLCELSGFVVLFALVFITMVLLISTKFLSCNGLVAEAEVEVIDVIDIVEEVTAGKASDPTEIPHDNTIHHRTSVSKEMVWPILLGCVGFAMVATLLGIVYRRYMLQKVDEPRGSFAYSPATAEQQHLHALLKTRNSYWSQGFPSLWHPYSTAWFHRNPTKSSTKHTRHLMRCHKSITVSTWLHIHSRAFAVRQISGVWSPMSGSFKLLIIYLSEHVYLFFILFFF